MFGNLCRTMSASGTRDLTAQRFKNDPVLEGVLDGKAFLRAGDRGSAVRKVQEALLDLGIPLPRFGADGDFGNETKGAVESFQRQAGFTGRDVDGIVGPKTLRVLNERFSTDAPPIVVPPEVVQPAPVPRNQPVDDRTSTYRVLSGVHLEGLAFGLLDEAAVYLLLDCNGCEITDATVGESIATFLPGLQIDVETGAIRDVTVDCGGGETVPSKRVSVTVTVTAGVESVGKIGGSETYELTACCCGCPGGKGTPGERVPDDIVGSDDLEEWMDDHPAGGLTGGLFSATTRVGGTGAVR